VTLFSSVTKLSSFICFEKWQEMQLRGKYRGMLSKIRQSKQILIWPV